METRFSKWLLAELVQRDWSQIDLAKKADVSPGHVSSVLSNKRKPTVSFSVKVAKALGYAPDIVLREAGYVSPQVKKTNLEFQWQHIFEQTTSDEERQALIELVQYQLDWMRKHKVVKRRT
ncbi:MAG: helix-turn-helix transcriptional regulator [Anaerolineales bacterium]|nr:helix-turn-helix transcriptional regulator [Anaerolineales bacterium]